MRVKAPLVDPLRTLGGSVLEDGKLGAYGCTIEVVIFALLAKWRSEGWGLKEADILLDATDGTAGARNAQTAFYDWLLDGVDCSNALWSAGFTHLIFMLREGLPSYYLQLKDLGKVIEVDLDDCVARGYVAKKARPEILALLETLETCEEIRA